MLLIFPLLTGFSGYANITFSKYLFFAIITLLWLMSLIFFAVLSGVYPSLKTKLWLPCTAFMLICTISAVFSDHFPETIIGAGRYDGLVTQLLCAGIFLGIAAFAKPKAHYFVLCGISAGLCCIIAIFQLFDINIFHLFPNDYSYYDAHTKYTGEFLGTMGNVDILSAYLCMCIPIFFSLLINARKSYELLFIIPLFLSSFILIAASTAAGFAALVGWAILFVPAICTDMRKFSRALIFGAVIILGAAAALAFSGRVGENDFSFSFALSGYSLALIVLAAVCLVFSLIAWLISNRCDFSPCSVLYLAAATAVMAFLIIVWGYDGSEGILYEFSQILHGNFDDSFGSSRILIWRTTLDAVSQKPLLGHGPDVLPLITNIEFSRYVPQTGETLTTFVDNAHNIYLGYLAGIGIIGLICFLFTVGSAFLPLHRSHFSTAIFGACAAYLIHSFFGLGLCLVSPIFWLFLGLCAVSDNNTFPEE